MRFIINGGKKLEGEVTLSGAKNAATKMMIASFLTDEPLVLENFPKIGDTEITAELCGLVGSKIENQGTNLKIQTSDIKTTKILSLNRRNRLPILALGALLARMGEVEVPIPGGDKIGLRPVDIHFEALKAMGATIENVGQSFVATAKNGLRGTKIILRFPSVGATENTILAAVLAKGRTTIQNAATEPEIIDLIKMLQKMGAIIELGVNRVIYIDGVKKLRGAVHKIIPDRNEAVSFVCLAAATNSRILVKDIQQDHLITFLNALRRIGGEYEATKDGIIFYRTDNLRSIELETDTHPGFMTDWQQPFTVLLTQANGVSVVHETIYEDRLGYAEDLNLMGADIKVFLKCLGELPCRFNGQNYPHSAVINGPTPLRGAELKVRDLRSGIAHIIAALIAKGESIIEGVEEIDRGYARIDERLRNLGANIIRSK